MASAYIQSHLLYGIGIWGSMISESQKAKLQTLQDRGINYARPKDMQLTNTAKMYKHFRCLRIDDLIKVELVKLVDFFMEKLLPGFLQSFLTTPNVHGHQTRFNLPFSSKVNRAIYGKSFVCKMKNVWQAIPKRITSMYAWFKIKKEIKSYFTENY